MAGEEAKITLPQLPYAYDALEPHIDETTMKFHHDFHHKGYTGKFKAAFEKLAAGDHAQLAAAGGIAGLVTHATLSEVRKVDAGLAGALQNNGGGWINHSLFWSNMAPPSADSANNGPDGDLAAAITADFGSFDAFKKKFAAAGATRFGSGWAWLAVKPSVVGTEVDGITNKYGLTVYSTANQDGPHNNADETALLGLDVWEHAYYLKYQNRRPEYISAFWHVANWSEVARRYAAAAK